MSSSERARRLEELLDALSLEHDRMLATLDRQADAIRAADAASLMRIGVEQREILSRIQALDAERRDVAGSDGETFAALAERAGEPAATALRRAAGRLRERVETVRGRGRVVAQAAGALDHHLRGLLHTLRTAIGQAGVYSPHGRLEPGREISLRVDTRR